MAAKKTTTAKTEGDETKPKRKANSAFMRPKQPSAELAEIVGSDPLPATEVTKKIWAYVKSNGLQKGRDITADAKLEPIFGGKKVVTMFEMTSLVSKHLKPIPDASKAE